MYVSNTTGIAVSYFVSTLTIWEQSCGIYDTYIVITVSPPRVVSHIIIIILLPKRIKRHTCTYT